MFRACGCGWLLRGYWPRPEVIERLLGKARGYSEVIGQGQREGLRRLVLAFHARMLRVCGCG